MCVWGQLQHWFERLNCHAEWQLRLREASASALGAQAPPFGWRRKHYSEAATVLDPHGTTRQHCRAATGVV